MGLKVCGLEVFAFDSFMFQVEHSNLETASFSNGPTFIQITNEELSPFEPLFVLHLF